MPRSENQKLKLLYIKEYLERRTDEDHPVSADVLAEYLQNQGISCERKSVYRDLEALREFGLDIQRREGRGGGFYLGERVFELPELKLLVDAVQSSRFLTEKKSRTLIRKLCALCSQDESRLLRREVAVAGRVKNMNESIYYNVDAIQEAIAAGKQISFRYFNWDLGHKKAYRAGTYSASPYALLWENDNYYLVSYTLRHGVTHFRVDRMEKIQILDQDRDPCPELEGSGLSGYAKKVFQMFRGQTETVKLRFHRSLANVVYDRFGPDCMLVPDGAEFFTVTEPMEISPMFLSWVMGFGSKAKILYPPSAIAACQDLAQEATAQYE